MDLEKSFYDALVASRPQGQIWEVRTDSVTDKKIKVLAKLLATVQTNADKLVEESDISTTKELLAEWEKEYGLVNQGSYEDRLSALAAASRPNGLQSLSYYKSIADAYEVAIEIVEHMPIVCGITQCAKNEDEAGCEDMVYCWEVIILSAPSDERISAMTAAFKRHKQAHVDLKFIYRRN